MSAERSLLVWESSVDLKKLIDNKFQLHFAKSVIGPDGKITFNIVYRSYVLGPRTRINWTPQYGLNYTIGMPAEGATVSIGGLWQPVTSGQSYDLDKYGLWTNTGGAGDPGWLTVGKNGYQAGINIIVGLKDGSTFNPIYIDPTNLGLNMKAKYKPTEIAEYWYETGNKTGTIMSSISSTVDSWDATNPDPTTDSYFRSSTYKYDSGEWKDSSDVPSVYDTKLLGYEKSVDAIGEPAPAASQTVATKV